MGEFFIVLSDFHFYILKKKSSKIKYKDIEDLKNKHIYTNYYICMCIIACIYKFYPKENSLFKQHVEHIPKLNLVHKK